MDRNYIIKITGEPPRGSLSARRAWIEITYVTRLPRAQVVALRKESVDRNWYVSPALSRCSVALRKESVDRNLSAMQIVIVVVESLSARRAWIEIVTLN